ncbi:hypothetical protein VNO77_40867 [Canavalia gladiata]|uniref:Remorin C-terminal domain-containing protein n=1 Tax=Canavalia gladiata TaxID=3824 RepID=A0AAN9JY16_CANGL
MKKSPGSSKKLGSFLSPEAPQCKGWSSERVLQPASSSIRHASGRTIPSKWDDAERWICSPVSGYANSRSSSYAQLQRRPKSKSGPIMPPGTAYYSNYSPTIPLRQGLVMNNFMMGSALSTGVLAPEALSLHHYYAHDAVFGPRYDIDNSAQCFSPVLNENSVALPSSPNSQDEKRDGTKNEEIAICALSKRDKGTQMSPPESENEAHSSPKCSPTWAKDKQNSLSTKLEVRDVEVDCQATVVRWSKSYAPKFSLLPGKDLNMSATQPQASGLDIAESTLDISKFQREEAKIIAWESLQKAKAEAAIRKLEMKLEKKKSSSIDKILNKLRRAQMKAEKMRNVVTVTVEQDQQYVRDQEQSFPFMSPRLLLVPNQDNC